MLDILRNIRGARGAELLDEELNNCCRDLGAHQTVVATSGCI